MTIITAVVIMLTTALPSNAQAVVVVLVSDVVVTVITVGHLDRYEIRSYGNLFKL